MSETITEQQPLMSSVNKDGAFAAGEGVVEALVKELVDEAIATEEEEEHPSSPTTSQVKHETAENNQSHTLLLPTDNEPLSTPPLPPPSPPLVNAELQQPQLQQLLQQQQQQLQPTTLPPPPPPPPGMMMPFVPPPPHMMMVGPDGMLLPPPPPHMMMDGGMMSPPFPPHHMVPIQPLLPGMPGMPPAHMIPPGMIPVSFPPPPPPHFVDQDGNSSSGAGNNPMLMGRQPPFHLLPPHFLPPPQHYQQFVPPPRQLAGGQMMMMGSGSVDAPQDVQQQQQQPQHRLAPPVATTNLQNYESDNTSISSFDTEGGSNNGSIRSGATGGGVGGNRMSQFIPLKEGDLQMDAAPMPTFTTLKRRKTVTRFLTTDAAAAEAAAAANSGNSTAAALAVSLSLQKNIEVYRASARSSNDQDVQFEFAKFCIENSSGIDDEVVRNTLLEEGFSWLKKLSQAGYTDAQYYLGQAYRDDNQHERAFAQFGLAAKKLHPASCHAVAQAFETGKGASKKDSRAALQFYKKAATAGHGPSMFRLGAGYLKGEITLRQNVREALKWLKRCAAVADRETAQALYQLHLIYESGYPDAGIYADESYSRSVLLEAAELKYPPALYKAGLCYEFGKLGFHVDPIESFRLYADAASGGEGEAAFSLSGLYLTGSSQQRVQQDESKALYWVRVSAETGLAKAQFALGFFYEKGIGMAKEDIGEAFKWYQAAASNGDEKAMQKVATRKPPKSSSSTSPSPSTAAAASRSDINGGVSISSPSSSSDYSKNKQISSSSRSSLRGVENNNNSSGGTAEAEMASSPVPIILNGSDPKKKKMFKSAGKCIIM